MKRDDVFQGMADTLKEGFDVGKAFGKPMEVQGTTVIPVARIALRGGEGVPPGEEEKQAGGGFGFWGGVTPVGYIQAKEGDVRWVQVIDWTRVIGNVSAVLLLFGMKAHRRKEFKKAWKAYRKDSSPAVTPQGVEALTSTSSSGSRPYA